MSRNFKIFYRIYYGEKDEKRQLRFNEPMVKFLKLKKIDFNKQQQNLKIKNQNILNRNHEEMFVFTLSIIND